MIQINETLIPELLSNPMLKKSDARTVIFLLQRPGALSSDELAAGVGVSKKSAGKSIKRLIGAGVIQTGEPQAKRRTFIVHLSEPKEPLAVTGENNKDRFDRLESMIGTLMDTLGAVLNPAPIHDGQNGTLIMPSLSCTENSDLINGRNGIEAGHKVTQAVIIPATDGQNETLSMPVYSHVDQQKNIKDTLCHESGQKRIIEEPAFLLQDKNKTVNIPKRTIGTEQGTKGPANDSIMADLDAAIIRARARQAALASFDKEKQQQQQQHPGAPASIGEVFKSLFGVDVPPGFTDMTAVETMVRRKQGGKLDNVKSPLAYLASLAGKVAPLVESKCAPGAQMNPESQMLVKPTSGISFPSVPVPSFDEYEQRRKIKTAWFGLTDEQRIPFHELREKKAMSGMPGRKVPVELLAFQQFTQECLSGRVQI